MLPRLPGLRIYSEETSHALSLTRRADVYSEWEKQLEGLLEKGREERELGRWRGAERKRAGHGSEARVEANMGR